MVCQGRPLLILQLEKHGMKRIQKPRSPKKELALKNSSQILNELELNAKNMAFELKGWEESLAILSISIDKFEKVAQKAINMDSPELVKEFSDTQSKLTKVNKEMENTQKTFNKLQSNFEKKLLTPMDTGEYNGLNANVLGEIRENIQKTKAGFESGFRTLNTVLAKSTEYTRRLALLEEGINKICLPDAMEKTVQLNEKLTKRLVFLCEVTASPEQSQDAASCDPNLKKSFLNLYTAHCKEDALLARIQKNIHVPDEDIAKLKAAI